MVLQSKGRVAELNCSATRHQNKIAAIRLTASEKTSILTYFKYIVLYCLKIEILAF